MPQSNFDKLRLKKLNDSRRMFLDRINGKKTEKKSYEVRVGKDGFCKKCDKKTVHRYIKETNMEVCERCYVGSAELE